MGRHLSQAQSEQIAAEFRRGKAAQIIANQMGVTTATVYNHLQRHGVPVDSRHGRRRTTKPVPPPIEVPRLRTKPAGDWQDHAACQGRDVEDFYVPSNRATDHARAKAICRTCPVADQCLEHALASGEEHGVWGGLTPHERDIVRRSRTA
jgi:WhiB family redox-sensing transcriptional regulator